VNARADIRHLLRRLGVAAILCLLLMHGGNIVPAPPHASSPLETASLHGVVQAPSAHCEAAPGKPELPCNHHSDCCPLCVSAARDVAFPVAFVLMAIDGLEPKEKSRAQGKFPLLPVPKPPGLRANWSATSPPRG
jgi:hypothetical protein